jgi:naphthalene 1,2-dioxygenase ferredoxin reductase component
VRVSGPFGSAYLRESHAGPIVAVAGGSGLAPVRSIVTTALRADPARRIHLYLGVRAERDVYGEEELRALAARHPGLSVDIVLSEPEPGSARRAGFVGAAVDADLGDTTGFKAYVAGPPPMVDHVQRVLAAKGMQPRDLHTDPFYSQAPRTT